jgi:selenide,water dikinase
LLADARSDNRRAADLSFALVTDGEILTTHDPKVRESFRRAFVARGIELHEHQQARAMTPGAIELEGGQTVAADAVLVTTGAAAPSWFRETGLALDQGGFLAASPSLQTLNDPDVFGAGDCVNLVKTPREKAGVFAVRAGPPLAANLRRRARGESLRPWRPQRRHLALISTGERYAVASRGTFKIEGAWVWKWKDWIDRRWMRMYQETDAMLARMPKVQASDPDLDEMRCGGCAAKIGPLPLSHALSRLPPSIVDGVMVGLDAPDDAAVLMPPKSGHLVQTVDFFRAFIDDPFVFGEIAANHALNDVFAMGAVPRYALATAVVPVGPTAKVEEALFQLLSGARACLDREGVALVGGHSREGTDLSLGLSVTGEVTPDRMIRKGGLSRGDALILTRPLGTGILFAAAMRGRASAASVAAALDEMRRSNRIAAAILSTHRATAMTDVTGFGLAGHLGEMLAASGADGDLDLSSIPIYADVVAMAQGGVASTLLPENLALLGLLRGDVDGPTKAILFDPQTSGGLLAGVPADEAAGCISELQSAGYLHASVVGHVKHIGVAPRDASISVAGSLADHLAGLN